MPTFNDDPVVSRTNGGSPSFNGGVYGESTLFNGVRGVTFAAGHGAVVGVSENHTTQAGPGVYGQSDGTGVWGQSTTWMGVYGKSDSTTGGAGVMGEALGSGAGVFGKSHTSVGVVGVSSARSGGVGVRGEGNDGVVGIATTSNMLGAGVRGENPVLGAAGVLGNARDGFGVVGLNGTGMAFGLHAGVAGASNRGPGLSGAGLDRNPGVFALGDPAVLALGDVFALGSAGFFGDVTVLGTLKATSKQFQIDHPLAPADKYLNHASVESSEMKTIYDGIVELDDSGCATVELPEWFEALNTEFRYQLTALAAAARDLHVAQGVSDNRFRIAGGTARQKVCWQVTGVRHDAAARAEPLAVETPKAAGEQGFFLRAEHHGQAREQGLAWTRHADLLRQAREWSTSAAAK